MRCPVCDGEAAEVSADGSNGLIVQCPSDGAFSIETAVVERFAGLGLEQRRGALERARLRQRNRGRATITLLEI